MKYLLTTLLVCIFIQVCAQNKVVLDGIIEDPQRKPIEGATILDAQGNLLVVSDPKGAFRITMPPGRHVLTITHISYKSRTLTHDFQSPDFVRVSMDPATLSLEEVIILDNNPKENLESTVPGASTLSIKNIEAIPAFMGEVDVIKSITLLPGVSTVGEGSAGYNVRGGGIDQNLVSIDGMQLFSTSHVLGFFSIFQPDATRDFTLYKGLVPAEFGGRASSVLEINSLQGQNERWSFEGGIGSISGKLAVQGPVTNKTTVLAAGRVTYSDWLLKLIKDIDIRNSEANFYDVFVRVDHTFNDKHHLMASYMGSADNFTFANEFGYEWANNGFMLNYDFQPSTTWRLDVQANYLKYTNALTDYTPGLESNLNNEMQKIQGRVRLSYTKGKHEAVGGMEVIDYNPGDEILAPDNEESQVTTDAVARDRGREYAVYVQDVFKITPRFDLNAGIRYTLYHQLGPSTEYVYDGPPHDDTITDTLYYSSGDVIKTYGNFSPRLALRYELNATTVLKASYNRLNQYIHLISNTTAPTPVDQWQVSTTYIPPTTSNNYSLGIYKNLNNDHWITSAEVFYRNLDNVIEYRDFAELILQENIEAELLTGIGKAYGLELFAKRITAKWTGWFTYVFTRSLVSFPSDGETINSGDWFPAYYDQPHSFKFVSDLRIGRMRRTSFGSNVVFNTGRPITALVSDYDQGSIIVPHYSDRNQYRVPNYFRIDLSLTIGSIIPSWDDKLNISLYNVLGRRNAYSVFYARTDTSPVPQAYKLSVLGSVFPSLTYTVKFDAR